MPLPAEVLGTVTDARLGDLVLAKISRADIGLDIHPLQETVGPPPGHIEAVVDGRLVFPQQPTREQLEAAGIQLLRCLTCLFLTRDYPSLYDPSWRPGGANSPHRKRSREASPAASGADSPGRPRSKYPKGFVPPTQVGISFTNALQLEEPGCCLDS